MEPFWDESSGRLRVDATRVALTRTQCRIWALPLDVIAAKPGMVDHCLALLNEEEHKLAHAFKRERPRRDFILCRGVLRLLLAVWTGAEPIAIKFGYGQFRKPFLQHPSSDFSFNVSHSGDLGLIAFCGSESVGVDLERHGPIAELEDFAHTVFGPEAYKEWMQTPEETRLTRLYDTWVRKEAVLKACGTGLGVGPLAVDISFQQGAEPVVKMLPEGFGKVADWTLRALDVAEGYSAAVAAGVTGLTLT